MNQEILISHVLFPWETFKDQREREQREKENGGIRWTEEFRKEIRQNIVRYSEMENQALRNSNLNEVYKMIPCHFRNELFKGVTFPIWN